MTPSILISGASVAGPALATCLVRAGWDVTVVERSEELRSEGQNIDVREAGRTVAKRLGIEGQIKDHNTTETGTEFVDTDGEVVASQEADGDDGPTAELEILRGQLSEILVDSSKEGATYRFGETIEAIDDGADGASVRFASGTEERFDVVAVAEGQGSSTRDMLFDDVELRRVGVDIAYFTIPRIPSDDDAWRVYTASEGRQVSVRPDNVGTIRAMLAFRSEDSDERYDELSQDEQVAMLRERYAGAGWQTDRLLDGLDTDDYYYESLTQVIAPTWSRGRTVLIGDSAHCVTPVAGFGTSLALIGAYLLAGNLTEQGDHAAAFAAYEEKLRPLVEERQKLPPGFPRLVYPESEAGAGLLRLSTKAIFGPIGSAVAKVIPSGDDDFELPRYRFDADSAGA